MKTKRLSSLLSLGLALPNLVACHSEVADSEPEPETTTAAAIAAAGKSGSAGAKGKGGAGGAGGAAGSSPAVPPAVIATATITQPKLGEPLYDNSASFGTTSWYNPGNQSIVVKGGFGSLPSNLNASKLAVSVNGYAMAFTYNAAAGSVQFEDAIPAPYDPAWAHRLLRAELVNTETKRVLARDYSWYFDLRYAGDATVVEDNDARVVGMAAQLTDFGIGADPADRSRFSALEVPHLSTLPHPSLATYNADLLSAVKALDVQKLADLSACQSVLDVEEATAESMRTLPAYIEAYALALTYYGIYKAWKDGGEEACQTALGALSAGSLVLGLFAQSACSVVMSNWCVKEQPKAEDFNLCVGRLDGDATSLDVSGMNDVDLSFLATPVGQHGADLSADLSMADVSGKLDIFLRDLSVKWADDSCKGAPKAGMSDSAIPESLQDFTTCHDVTIDADEADTDGHPAHLRIARDEGVAGDYEHLNVVKTLDAKFSLVDAEVDSAKDSCELDFLKDHAETLAERFPALFADTLSDVWNEGANEPLQARALELLVDRLELGIPTHADFALDAAHELPSSLPNGGARFTLNTLLTPVQDSMAWNRRRAGWFHHPPPDVLDPYYSDLGLMPEDANGDMDPFGLSFTLTTGYLNQILHIRGATERLYFTYEPTAFQLAGLGISVPTLFAPQDKVPLDGSILGQFHPVFSALGSTTVGVTISPTMDPIVYMDPDAPVAPEGAPLSYGTSGLEIRFTSVGGKGTGHVTGVEWLRAVLYFVDKDFQIKFDAEDPRYLSAAFADEEFSVVIEQNLFSTCTMDVHGSYEPASSCERGLEKQLTSLFTNLLRPRFLGMLSDLEAPQVWDAAGEASEPVRIEQIRRYLGGQYVNLFGNFPTDE